MPKIFGKKNVAMPTVTSYWPQWVRRLFETLKEIPWLSLTAVGTLVGVLILFSYFRSIDYFPSDFSALISLGAATTVCAVGLMFVLALGLFAPAAIYKNYVSDEVASTAEVSRSFSEIELVFLQLGGVGLTFGLIAFSAYRDCGTLFSWYGFIGIGLLVFWLVACLKIVLSNGTRKQRVGRCYTAVAIAIFSMVTCLILIPLLPVLASESLDTSVIFLTLWALAILANASAAKNLPRLAIAIFSGVVVVLLFIVVPVATNQASVFPKMVASYLGVREEKPQDLRVSAKTCQLIQSALGASLSSKDVICSMGDWGVVKALTLSNVGEQWLIELAVEHSSELSKPSKLRLTIPRSDVQVVRLIDDKPVDGKQVACAK